MFSSEQVRNHIKRVNLARESFRTADVDDRIKRALKARINSNFNEIFHNGDKFYFKDKEIHDKYKDEWSGPATILGSDGKVLFLKYGNMLRRVHITKVVKENNSFSRNSSEMGHNDDKSTNNDEHNQTSDYPEEQSIEKSNYETENMVLPKRPSLLRCPDNNRKISFKELNSDIWKEGEVIKVCKLDNKGSSCILKLDNNVEEEIN